jgi:hypothetical protein
VTAPDGTPLSGVTLSEWDVKLGPEDHNVAFPTGLTATTDDRGRYSVTGDLVVRTPWVIWMARKPGYFSIGNISRTTSDAQIDLVMNPWTYIALGEVVRGTVKPGDTVCGEPNERCHYFALTVPAGGRLETTLTTAIQGQGWDLHVETAAGEAYGPPMGAPLPLRVSIQVEAAATYQIRVLSFSPTPSDYELTTRLH